jgi:hypothetical protein
LYGYGDRWRIREFIDPKAQGDSFGKGFFDMPQVTDYRITHVNMFNLGKLKY